MNYLINWRPFIHIYAKTSINWSNEKISINTIIVRLRARASVDLSLQRDCME